MSEFQNMGEELRSRQRNWPLLRPQGLSELDVAGGAAGGPASSGEEGGAQHDAG